MLKPESIYYREAARHGIVSRTETGNIPRLSVLRFGLVQERLVFDCPSGRERAPYFHTKSGYEFAPPYRGVLRRDIEIYRFIPLGRVQRDIVNAVAERREAISKADEHAVVGI